MDAVSYLAGVSIRPLVLATLAALFLRIGRVKSAANRHAVWTIVTAAMLFQPVITPVLPAIRLLVIRRVTAKYAKYFRSPAPVERSGALTKVKAPESNRRPAQSRLYWLPSWQQALVAAYASAALLFLIRLLFGFLFTLRLVRASEPIRGPSNAAAILYESSWLSVPVTLGFIRRKILLPRGWRDWNEAKFRAVLAHEESHVLRADWAISLIAGVNRSLFWFHPLAWWLERTLARLAEQACDDAALRVVEDREQYARALLEMAQAVTFRQGRLVWEAIAMAKKEDMRRRIERILDETRPIPSSFTRLGWSALVACSVPTIYFASAVRLAPAQTERVMTLLEASYLESLAQASNLTAADAQNLEQHLKTNPDDLAARSDLVAYYYANGFREPRLRHIFWAIEHHPESDLARFSSAGISPAPSLLNDTSEYAQADSLWRNQVALHPDDAAILGNAAQFFSQPGGDFDEAENLLIHAHEVQPLDPDLPTRLAQLYADVIRDTAVENSSGSPAPMANVRFADRVKSELQSSTDGWLMTLVGMYLIRSANGVPDTGHDAQLQPVIAFANTLEKRSELFGVRHIGPGASVQDDESRPKLLYKAATVYPEEVKEAGIEGKVIVSAIVGKDGQVSRIVNEMGNPLLLAAFVEAAKQYVFKPAMKNGEPVETKVVLEHEFRRDDSPGARAREPQVIRIGQGVLASMLKTKIEPVYPEQARAAGIEGTVRFRVKIGEDGRVQAMDLIDGHPLLAAAAQAAVKQWTYDVHQTIASLRNNPRIDKRPIQIEAEVAVPFHLVENP